MLREKLIDSGFNDKEKLSGAIDDLNSQGVKIIIGPFHLMSLMW